MEFKILIQSDDTEEYVEDIQHLADSQRDELGFLPSTVYEEQSTKGRLWVAVEEDTGELAGHLLFGGRYPNLKIFQLYVVSKFRGKGVGKDIINRFIKYGEDNHYQTITAKVAADIAANKFWDACGIEIIRQVPGGKTKNRIINERFIELEGNSLFCSNKNNVPINNLSDFSYPPLTSLPNATYVIDINVLFDLIKNRNNRDSVQHIFSLALNNDISIAVTSEFTKELDRSSHNFKNDPTLEFARALPTLPEVSDTDLAAIMSHLRSIIFSGIPKTGKFVVNDTSDLRHLASCIHHKIQGFLTSEKAILKCSEELRNQYNIEVLSVSDLQESTLSISNSEFNVKAEYGDNIITIKKLEECNRKETEVFLENSGLNNNKITQTLHPGVQTSKRHRYIIITNERIVAVATWDDPTKHKFIFKVNLIIDESSSAHSKITDHLLEKIHRSCPYNRLIKVHLVLERHQINTIETTKCRGYRTSSNNNSNCYELAKICFNGVITKNNWEVFIDDFNKLTGITLPGQIPTFAEAKNTGIYLKTKESVNDFCVMSLYDFETLISPGILKLDGRKAAHVPIRESFASELLNSVQRQKSLFPEGENLLHIEKSYFMKANSHKKFEAGGIVIFYVSGADNGRMESIGMARVIYADTLNIESAKVSFSRQGVLPSSVLEDMADKNGMIGIITFDNFMKFKNPLKYNTLKKLGCISGANLVTTEKLSKENFDTILEKAFE